MSADNQIPLSPNVGPPQLFQNEPIVIIFDPNHYIAEQKIDLNPFNEILTIITDRNHLTETISRSNKRLNIIVILPESTQARAQLLIQSITILPPNIDRLRLFFIDGQHFHVNILNAHSHSITSKILPLTRETCAQTNTQNIQYCDRERVLNEQRDDFGIAYLYAQQIQTRTDIQLLYNERIRLEFNIRRLR